MTLNKAYYLKYIKALNKTMKITLPTTVNPAYSSILFSLAVAPDNSLGLSKKLGKTQGIVYRQMQTLKKEGWIAPDNSKLNAYAVNWDKVLLEFAVYVDSLAKKQEQKYKERSKDALIHPSITRIQQPEFKKEILKNKLLGQLMSFSFWMHPPTKETIEDIFRAFIDQAGFLISECAIKDRAFIKIVSDLFILTAGPDMSAIVSFLEHTEGHRTLIRKLPINE